MPMSDHGLTTFSETENTANEMLYQVVDEPGQKVSSGVKSANNKSDDIAKDFLVVAGVVQDRIQQRGLIVVARFPRR